MRTIAPSVQRRHRHRALVDCVGLAVVAAASAVASAQVASEPILSAVRSLDLAGGRSEASGVAITRFFAFADGTSEEDLRVEVRHLRANTRYEVVIDEARAATIVTDTTGAAALLLAAPVVPGARAVPAALFPVNSVDSIVVRDPEGAVVLSGDFANARRRQRLAGDDGRISD